MKIKSFNEQPDFKGRTILTSVMLETGFSKEVRICMKKGHVIKEHKSPLPIIVHVYQGEVNFGVDGTIVVLKEGDAITLAGGVPHDLEARKDCMLRLTLAKADRVERVEKVIASTVKEPTNARN
ncbi:cupin domain-containing protein [Neolewinella antarctica]|uniref:Quercetin dioxygenase-like cupin family protein n=1 Tax=Neolewinella antarctica TaxID=442734 RepID=A0ABX0XCR2_9BACT|nr:cupin domain-containing protein [Neolewinella antarctica]NJC26982.1 quercetin dioxygenase-like cupin family protein [Neolewinella antarctica]